MHLENRRNTEADDWENMDPIFTASGILKSICGLIYAMNASTEILIELDNILGPVILKAVQLRSEAYGRDAIAHEPVIMQNVNLIILGLFSMPELQEGEEVFDVDNRELACMLIETILLNLRGLVDEVGSASHNGFLRVPQHVRSYIAIAIQELKEEDLQLSYKILLLEIVSVLSSASVTPCD
ncbi:hypothetical protein HK101_009899 [Irineochytrium annulatum]|nr:hypothetical protein HK101_009899 [Irineochytrium annulatum]